MPLMSHNPNPAGNGMLPHFPAPHLSYRDVGGSGLAPRCQQAPGSSRGTQRVVIKRSGLINEAGEGERESWSSRGRDGVPSCLEWGCAPLAQCSPLSLSPDPRHHQ